MNGMEISTILQLTELKSFDDNWNLTKKVTSIVDSSEGRKIIIHILDIWNNVNDDAKQIWLDIIERAGFYPYYIDKVSSNNQYALSLQSQIRTAFFKSDYLHNVYFHEQQKEIEQALSLGSNIAVSAPTSFGKSLLIEEVVARKKFNNILIIQPTLALIDETRQKMSYYSDYYNIVVNTRQEAKDKNIFILTAERVLEFLDLPNIDFFVIDEFYKISTRRNDDRIDALNVALIRIMSLDPQAMFLTPTVDSLSKKFREKYQIRFFNTDYALVNTNLIEIRNRNGNPYSGKSKKMQLFKLLNRLNEPSIVYVKSPNEAYKLANEYLDWLEENSTTNNSLDIFEWIDSNISPDWQLKRLLQNGIGAHNGALPRHIVTSEIDLFNSGNLNVLFATVSLIEGVNTVAKNMIVYSHNKGTNPIDFFDFANIRGRAGRMGQYFTGNVYIFNDELGVEEFVIDVPYIDQHEISDEILINIPDDDVLDTVRKEKLTSGLDYDLQDIIKRNLISVSGQKNLYYFIEDKYEQLNFLRWRNVPNYEQLWQTLYLGYRFLGSNDRQGFAQNKAVTALKLINTSLPQVILEQKQYYQDKGKQDPINKAIDYILKFQRNEANFKIPKLLAVIDSIQKYVFEKKGISDFGDYTYFSSILENDKIDERFQFLIDYGVPTSAINKISKIIPANISGEWNIINYLKVNFHAIKPVLISYEISLVLKVIN
ncbi:Helicase conserved C-terminal domain protein [Marinilactibacillus psychrotolerans 42ea]|uniref:Helicase conserved C-terminal domain protein n=1 Tax=Marinilactibacillus psychrotolerans 42ea TaxID=1255609 RepID=A0A1R4K6C7_9LACT|nr:DEAD/DEAH box helicase [Marinilactibacillus psychrotolerans]SJN39665.1 Helicase conserved C-terminal domain protein [Marinilactibacillus psychrotolerans 42ea]